MRQQRNVEPHDRLGILTGRTAVAAGAIVGLSVLLVALTAQVSLAADAGRDFPASLEGWQKAGRRETPLMIFPPDLPNLDFSAGTAGWDLPAGYSFDAHGGRHGGKCLVYTRPEGGRYNFAGISFPVAKLIPGATYSFGCWIKTQDVHGGGGAGLIVEFSGRHGYVGGIMPVDQGKGVFGNSDWKWFEGQFTVPPAGRRIFASGRGSAGILWQGLVRRAQNLSGEPGLRLGCLARSPPGRPDERRWEDRDPHGDERDAAGPARGSGRRTDALFDQRQAGTAGQLPTKLPRLPAPGSRPTWASCRPEIMSWSFRSSTPARKLILAEASQPLHVEAAGQEDGSSAGRLHRR